MTDPLTEIGLRAGTDKASWHGYTKYYHEILEPFRGEKLFFLELGFGGYEYFDTGGESVRMWAEYAPRWDIAVLDLYAKSSDLVPDGVQFYQGSQDDPEALNKILFDHGDPTIVVDDASHVASLTSSSFWLLWSHVKPGGWYIIEDIGTCYNTTYGGNPSGIGTPIELAKNLIDNIVVNSRHGLEQGYLADIGDFHVDTMHVMPNSIGFRKR